MGREPFMRSKLNAALLMISLAVAAGSAPQSPNEDQLARFMEKVRQDMTGIRDSTCLETIERTRRRPPHTDFAPIDIVRLEVSTVAGKELFASPGHRFEDRDLQSLIRSGTIGSGMFSTFVQNLFVKRQGTLRYARQENVDGRRLVRYDFRATRRRADSNCRSPTFQKWWPPKAPSGSTPPPSTWFGWRFTATIYRMTCISTTP
jgi:hypothetical protein